MPATKSKPASNVQEQTLDAIRESQQAVVHAVHTWAESVEGIIPAAPSFPFGEQVPAPQELLKTSFDFAEQLLKSQREFAESLLAAYAPLLDPRRGQEQQ
jgi:hypothetical protein